MSKMAFVKETKHTVVFGTSDPLAPVSSVYVSKIWLATKGVPADQYRKAGIDISLVVAWDEPQAAGHATA
jgi:hypothetical protein